MEIQPGSYSILSRGSEPEWPSSKIGALRARCVTREGISMTGRRAPTRIKFEDMERASEILQAMGGRRSMQHQTRV